MKARRLCAVLAISALAFAALPALADDHEPDGVPEACGDREFDLADDEVLVERTVYLKSESQVGNADVVEYALDPPSPKLYMEEPEPDSPDPKLYVVPTGGNDEYAGNFLFGYWTQNLMTEPDRRIVCAEATVHALSRVGMRAQLWVDTFGGVGGEPAADVNAVADGTGLRTYTANFTETFGPDGFTALDATARWNVMLQVIFPTGTGAGSTVVYDSTEFPSQLTYVTVETLDEFSDG